MIPISIIFLLFSISAVLSQCPTSITPPCECTSTRYEAVSIVCDKANSLDSVLKSLSNPPKMIDSLVISNTPIEELPGFAFQNFKIKRLQFRNNGMFEIHPDAFSGMVAETIEELEIRGNHFESIPQSGITQIKNMKVLSLSDNMISTVGDNAFLSYYSRNSLVKLDLSANNMTGLYPQAFLGLDSLLQLSLDKNLLTEIPTMALANIATLEDLSMGVNQIDRIVLNALPLPALKSLSLEVNKIRSINAEAFESVPNLSYLYLGNNLFTRIEPTMFFHIRLLKVLSLVNNKDITTIATDSFRYVPGLIRLEMSDCSLTDIEQQSLHKMPKIQVIVLSRNQLTRISSATFAALPEVVSIDLSANAINTIEDFAFSRLPTLSHLDLSSNRLETLPQNMLYETLIARLNRPRVLYLQNNPWRCDEHLTWLRKWLRENGDVQTSAPGGTNTRCWTPSQLSGLDIRQTDPVQSRTNALQVGEPMRKYVQTTPPSYAPVEATNMVGESPKISQVNMILVVFAIVVGFLAVCLILLGIIRCIMKSAGSSQKKEHSAQFSSPTMSSNFSTAYSGSGMFPEQYRQRSATNANVFLNRPRYWWF